MKIKTLKLEDTWYPMLEMLDTEQLGEVLKAMMDWNNHKEPVFHGIETKMAFNLLLPNLTRQAEVYEKRTIANRINGNKGGRPKKSN